MTRRIRPSSPFATSVLAQYGVSRIEDLPVNFRGLALRKDDENGFAIFDVISARCRPPSTRRTGCAPRRAFSFPSLAMQPFSTSFSGTDSWHQYDFATAAEAHRRRIQTCRERGSHQQRALWRRALCRLAGNVGAHSLLRLCRARRLLGLFPCARRSRRARSLGRADRGARRLRGASSQTACEARHDSSLRFSPPGGSNGAFCVAMRRPGPCSRRSRR